MKKTHHRSQSKSIEEAKELLKDSGFVVSPIAKKNKGVNIKIIDGGDSTSKEQSPAKHYYSKKKTHVKK